MSKKRVLLGLSIIAGGVCASLPFRREMPGSLPSHPGTPIPAAEAATPLLVQSLPATGQLPAGNPSPYLDGGSQWFSGGSAPSSVASIQAEEVSALPRGPVHSPPMLPVSFQVKEPEPGRLQPWQPAPLAEGPAGPPREYRIRKLDTLEDLAERFLGSRDRADELFEANRGVLQNRHVLPLGAVLRIPEGITPVEPADENSDLRPIRPGP